MNGKFSRPASDPADGHVPLGTVDLTDIRCFEYERVVMNDYVVRFECRLFQMLKSHKMLPRPREKVTVRIHLEGTLNILWKGKPLLVEEIKIPKKGQPISYAA